MIKHILQFIVLFIFLIFAQKSVNGQILKETLSDLNLNPGGVIHDVVFDEYSNTYIVVGDFVNIGGLPRKNLAFVDADNFTVLANDPITDIDGAIHSVEIYNDPIPYYTIFPPTLPDGEKRHLYLGGEFIVINSDTLPLAARLSSIHLYASPPATFAPYTIDVAWKSGIYAPSQPAAGFVSDITLKGDTVVFAGDFRVFTGVDSYSAPYAAYDFTSILAFNATVTNVNSAYVPLFENFVQVYYGEVVHKIESFKNEFFIAGSSKYSRFDADGILISNFSFNGANASFPARDFDVSATTIDTLFLGYIKYSAGFGNYVNNYDGTSLNAPFASSIPQILTGGYGYQEVYKDYVFTVGNSLLEIYKRNGTNPVAPTTSFQFDTPFITSANESISGDWYSQRIKVTGNKLFAFGDLLTNVDGISKDRIAVFCLEPNDPKNFTVFDALICEGNTEVYTIPPTGFAEGYRWTYTGNGASWRIAGTSNVFLPLSDTSIANLAANSIEINFGTGTSSGDLSVQPFSLCNTLTDYLYAKEKTITLSAAPSPNISLVTDTMSFTCVRDSFFLVSQSSTPSVTYDWQYGFDTLSVIDSVMISINDATLNVLDSTYFYSYVYEPINGCRATDSVFVFYDTIAEQINVADILSSPAVFNCLSDSLELSLVIPNATIMWDLSANAAVPSMSSYTIYDPNDSLLLYAYATYDVNGCTSQQQYTITTDVATLPATLVGYTNFGTASIHDSVNCFTPSLNIQCGFTSGTGIAEWVIGGIPSGDLLNLTEVDTLGMSAFNLKTYQFITTNTDNGCVDTNNATFKFDFEIPNVPNYSGPNSLNCSAISLELAHLVNGNSNIVEGWLDAVNTQTLNDTLLINVIGEYYYEVQNLNNGCYNRDTVNVIQTNELLLDLICDTLICPNEVATIIATPINNTETTTYIWSNGSTAATTSVTGGIDSQVTVIAQTASGCIANDTLNVLITAPVTATFIISSGCSNGNIEVSNVLGGAGNYQYSLDGATWQTNTAFTDLNFGAHTVYISDDLNCVYPFTETITNSAQGLDVNFLVSTYNENGDTLAIVNVSDFTGFDSLVWILPNGSDIYSIDDSMVVLSIASGGWYDVTLLGYQDTCGFSFTKPVFFGTEKPTYEEDYEAVGIQTLLIYPNPTTGLFTVEIEYGIAQNYSIVVTNMQGQPVAGMSVSGVGKTVGESFSFPISATPGPYGIHIISDFDATQKTIILN